MAQVVIRTRAKEESGNPYVDRHRWGRGDVIAILPDAHVLSVREASNPDWRVFQVPQVDPIRLASFLAVDTGYGDREAEKANRVLRRRAFRLDLETLEALLADNKKSQELLADPVKAEAYAMELLTAADELIDPAVIG